MQMIKSIHIVEVKSRHVHTTNPDCVSDLSTLEKNIFLLENAGSVWMEAQNRDKQISVYDLRLGEGGSVNALYDWTVGH